MDVVVHERRRGKPWYKSKIIIANILSAAIAILLILSQSPSLQQYGEWLSLAQSVLTVILRFTSSQPVTT